MRNGGNNAWLAARYGESHGLEISLPADDKSMARCRTLNHPQNCTVTAKENNNFPS
jgi:hypothetical protein